MNRREFLKASTAVIAAAVLPISLTTGSAAPVATGAFVSRGIEDNSTSEMMYVGFDPHMLYGNGVLVDIVW